MRSTIYKEGKTFTAYANAKKYNGLTKQKLMWEIKKATNSNRCYIRRNELVFVEN